MAASSSKARARPIPRDLSSSEDSSQDLDEILTDSNIQPRQLSLLAPRLPRLHSIKGPFQLVLGGVLTNPTRSRTRKTDFKLIERLPDVLRGQFKFLRDEGPTYRPLTLISGPSYIGAWRKVFASTEYPRLAFKLSPATEDLSYTTVEIRAFRQTPDFTAQFIQEFHSWISLLEPNRPANEPHRPIQQVHFYFMICERLIPYSQADFSGLDPEEITYRMALAVAMVSKRGFRLKDCGRGNWGFGLRNGRILLLLLDGNSWTRLDPSDELFGKWPPKKLIGSFWPLLQELHEQASAEIYQEVYYPQNATQFDATHISEFLLRRLSGLDSPQTWNPFRGAIIFLPSRDVAVALMHSFSAIVVIFLWDITMYISFPFNVFNVISNSVPLRALCGGLCDQSPIFLFTSSPIYHHWTTYNFGMPALRYFAVDVFTTDHFLF